MGQCQEVHWGIVLKARGHLSSTSEIYFLWYEVKVRFKMYNIFFWVNVDLLCYSILLGWCFRACKESWTKGVWATQGSSHWWYHWWPTQGHLRPFIEHFDQTYGRWVSCFRSILCNSWWSVVQTILRGCQMCIQQEGQFSSFSSVFMGECRMRIKQTSCCTHFYHGSVFAPIFWVLSVSFGRGKDDCCHLWWL